MCVIIENVFVIEVFGKFFVCDKDNGWFDFEICGKIVNNKG